MDEHLQLYICPTCQSIKTVFGQTETFEEFKAKIPEKIPCKVNHCDDYALPKDKICSAEGHAHGYIYYKDYVTGLIVCSRHKEEGYYFDWHALQNDNIFDSIKDAESPSKREGW